MACFFFQTLMSAPQVHTTAKRIRSAPITKDLTTALVIWDITEMQRTVNRVRLLLRMRRMYVECEAWNEQNAQNAISSRTFGPSITRDLSGQVQASLVLFPFNKRDVHYIWRKALISIEEPIYYVCRKAMTRHLLDTCFTNEVTSIILIYNQTQLDLATQRSTLISPRHVQAFLSLNFKRLRFFQLHCKT